MEAIVAKVRQVVKEATTDDPNRVVKPDWGKLSMYGHDFLEPSAQCYKKEQVAIEIKKFIQSSHIPFSDPRACPKKSFAQFTYAEPEFTEYNARKPRSKEEIRTPYAIGPHVRLQSEYRGEMEGERLFPRDKPFSPKNYPFEMVISPTEFLYSKEYMRPKELEERRRARHEARAARAAEEKKRAAEKKRAFAPTSRK